MSNSQPASEGEVTHVRSGPQDPKRNPSYPPRKHTNERPHWQQVLRDVDARIAPFTRQMGALGTNPDRPKYERLHAQMLGARDQVADAVRRLPGEMGDLYEEDKHRVDEALAALERLAGRW